MERDFRRDHASTRRREAIHDIRYYFVILEDGDAKCVRCALDTEYERDHIVMSAIYFIKLVLVTPVMSPMSERKLHNLERFPVDERSLIARALEFAKIHHAPQRRISGEPYIVHPVAVAQLLIDEFHADAETVAAGLLHDTVEDTSATLEDIKREFGPVVAHIVDGVTIPGKGDGKPVIELRVERDAATHQKVLEYGVKDERVYLVKIADRWHNMTTCSVMRPASQLRLAKETVAFHVPLCIKLGFADIASRVERLCLSVISANESRGS